jgi:hypothetical protein
MRGWVPSVGFRFKGFGFRGGCALLRPGGPAAGQMLSVCASGVPPGGPVAHQPQVVFLWAGVGGASVFVLAFKMDARGSSVEKKFVSGPATGRAWSLCQRL